MKGLDTITGIETMLKFKSYSEQLELYEATESQKGAGKLHGTTPGSHKKMTLSLGYLMRTETFRDLVKKNHTSEANIYIDTKYMQGQYLD